MIILYSAAKIPNKFHLIQGIHLLGVNFWALDLKVLVLDSIGCASQFESYYLHFEKNFLGQRFTSSWAYLMRTVISLQLKILKKHGEKPKKKKKLLGPYINLIGGFFVKKNAAFEHSNESTMVHRQLIRERQQKIASSFNARC